jgi:hypothetical protein
MGKAASKKADAKKTSAKLQLKALINGRHNIDGGTYSFKEGDVITVSKKSHYDSMKELVTRFSEV